MSILEELINFSFWSCVKFYKRFWVTNFPSIRLLNHKLNLWEKVHYHNDTQYIMTFYWRANKSSLWGCNPFWDADPHAKCPRLWGKQTAPPTGFHEHLQGTNCTRATCLCRMLTAFTSFSGCYQNSNRVSICVTLNEVAETNFTCKTLCMMLTATIKPLSWFTRLWDGKWVNVGPWLL